MANDKPNTPKFPRGTGIEHQFYTGEDGTLSIDTDVGELRLHDGNTPGGTSIPSEAPKDGVAYVRKDGEWVQVEGGEAVTPVSLSQPSYHLHHHQAAVAEYHSAYIDDDGRLFVTGSFWDVAFNGYVEIMPEKRFKMVTSDPWSSGLMALDTEGHIWTAGEEEYEGEYGIPSDRAGEIIWPPETVIPGDDWTFVHAGEYGASFGIKADGTLWSWGDDSMGAIGRETETGNDPIPTLLPIPEPVVYVDSLYWRGYAVSNTGNIYSWGYNYYGSATGEGHEEDAYTPVLVSSAPKATPKRRMAFGSYVGLLIDEQGYLYYAGETDTGWEQDTVTEFRLSMTWERLGNDNDWDFLSGIGDWTGFVAVKTNGDAYIFGTIPGDETADTDGWDRAQYFHNPTPFLMGKNVVDVVTGFEGAYFAITKNGDLYGWGHNYWAEVGDGSWGYDPTTDTYTEDDNISGTGSPTFIMSGVRWVRNDHYSTIAMLMNGEIRTWGKNWSGCIGVPEQTFNAAPVSRPFDPHSYFPVPATGVGPAVLQKGDAEFGFYGFLDTQAVISLFSLGDIYDLRKSYSDRVDQPPREVAWVKYSYQGKICYMPLRQVTRNVTYNEILAKEIVVTDPAVHYQSDAIYQYQFRLLSGTNEDPYTDGASTAGSEWDMVMRHLWSGSDVPEADRWGSFTAEELGFDTSVDGRRQWVQELGSTAGEAVLRGNTGDPLAIETISVDTIAGDIGYRPVLELVDLPEAERMPSIHVYA